MITNWPDVVDSAVKIGLGALLGGGFSLVIAWLSYQRNLGRDYFKRRRELIEKAVRDLDNFYRAMSLFRASLQNLLFKKNSQQPASHDDQTAIKALEKKLYVGFSDLYTVRSTLILLDEDALEKNVERFIRQASAFFKVASIENPKLTDERINKYKKSLDTRRKKILSGLSVAYRKVR